jgi:HEAT repeat protein
VVPADPVRVCGGRNLFQRLLGHAPPGSDPVSALTTLLDDREPSVRAEAAFSLWQIDRHAASVPVLVSVIHDSRSTKNAAAKLAASRAAECLGLIGAEATLAAPVLREALTHDYEWVRVQAARALWRIEGKAEEVVAVLIAETRGRPAGLVAIECLGEIGPLASPGIPALKRILDSDRRVAETVEDDEAFQAAAERALELIQKGARDSNP